MRLAPVPRTALVSIVAPPPQDIQLFVCEGAAFQKAHEMTVHCDGGTPSALRRLLRTHRHALRPSFGHLGGTAEDHVLACVQLPHRIAKKCVRQRHRGASVEEGRGKLRESGVRGEAGAARRARAPRPAG